MPRWFNTAGPCAPEDHYMLPASRRVPQVRALVDRKAYFVVHAPRQVGKTTSLLGLSRELTSEGKYAAVVVSMIVGANRTIRSAGDMASAEAAILDSWRLGAENELPAELRPPAWPELSPGNGIGGALAAWARACPRPLVLFLDEFDALRGELLVSVMRQLQGGYPGRPHGFPSSVALVGLRDMKDYRFDEDGLGRAGAPSPFNIVVASLTVPNFDARDVADLYAQHTADTGQVFEPAACARVMELTGGQPWLVNALAAEATDVVATDRSLPVTTAHIEQARDNLLARRTTHLDNLSDKLREPRVRAVIEPMLAGEVMGQVPFDDRQYVLDLGLVRKTDDGGLDIANPIYREIVARTLASGPRDTLPHRAHVARPEWPPRQGQAPLRVRLLLAKAR